MKRVIITGGTGGLGKSISKQFIASGWDVISLGSKELNLTDQLAVNEYFTNHRCDLLICAAGIIRDQPLSKMSEETWDEVFAINYTAAKNCAKAVILGMAEKGEGHIIFISSYAAEHPAIGQAAYAAAKASLLGLTKDMASEYGKSGIRVNAVLPGFLETPMTKAVKPHRKEVVKSLHLLGEFNQTTAVSEFINFLEERMPWTSGQIFQLDSRP